MAVLECIEGFHGNRGGASACFPERGVSHGTHARAAVEVQGATHLLEVMGLFGVRLGNHVALVVLGDGHEPVHLIHGFPVHAHRGGNGLVGIVAQRDAAHVSPHGGELPQHFVDKFGVPGREQLRQVLHRDAQGIDGAEQHPRILRVVALFAQQVNDGRQRRNVPNHGHGPVFRVQRKS